MSVSGPKKSLSIDVIYDYYDAPETNDRELSMGEDTAVTAGQICQALKSMGHTVSLVPLSAKNYQQTLAGLSGDLIFNQVEEDELGYQVLLLLEKLKKPVTGVDSRGYLLSWDKQKVKQVLDKAGVPTPASFVAAVGQTIDQKGLSFPLFVKAVDDHGSLSITGSSVVNNLSELISQVKWVKDTIGGDSLVESYIDGRELGITVLGNGKNLLILPPREIIFNARFPHRHPVVTYEAKWKLASPDYLGTSMVCPAKLSASEKKAIDQVINQSCQALNVRDYARFDIRLQGDIPYVIDYNPNPAIGALHDSAPLSAAAFGLTYPQFINSIVSVALARYR